MNNEDYSDLHDKIKEKENTKENVEEDDKYKKLMIEHLEAEKEKREEEKEEKKMKEIKDYIIIGISFIIIAWALNEFADFNVLQWFIELFTGSAKQKSLYVPESHFDPDSLKLDNHKIIYPE